MIEQVPKANLKLERGSKIYLYTDEKENKVTVNVPNVVKKNVTNAINTLNKYNLNYIIKGTKGSVVSQEPKEGSIVQEGSIITLKIK